MSETQGKIKEFFEQEAEKIVIKIEKTPMEKFFIFFLIMITISAIILGYLQLKRNIEMPFFAINLSQKRAEIRDQYLSNLNTATSSAPSFSITNLITNTNSTEINTNINSATNTSQININGTFSNNNILNLERQLLSGEVTLEELGINDPELQKYLELIQSGELNEVAGLESEQKTQAIESLKTLTPAQIREELIKNGIDKTFLDQIDDQTLQQMFLETLKTYQ
ncbi:hypothetical protein JW977_03720 [Candidatus Falkowbacteria bacterium]|nr:hypothetical protein [Candidatus Falkowbacteria bacterium]